MSMESNGVRSSRSGSVEMESGRERVMRAAYELFSRDGVRSVGVDTVIAEAGVAKMTLYRNFPSKEDLVLAFLRRREELWTHGWVEREVLARADTPAGRLLAAFDLFDEWFRTPNFEGCAFVSILLEVNDPDSAIRKACVRHLAHIRDLLAALAGAAGISDSDNFARQWQILLKGSIISAAEGDEDAAKRAKEMGILLLARHGITV
jgi:AcrR family transcriptional regulator